MRPGLIIILLLCCAPAARAQSAPSSVEAELPSAAMLEFLGDLEPLDEETWQLLEHHALRDAAETKEVKSE